MPTTYRIDGSLRIVFTNAEGNLSAADLQGLQEGVRGDPEFDPTFRNLVDLRAVKKVTIAGEEMNKLARSSPFAAGVRRAIVAPSESVFGMSRMYQMMGGDSADEVSVFRGMAEAMEWLRLD